MDWFLEQYNQDDHHGGQRYITRERSPRLPNLPPDGLDYIIIHDIPSVEPTRTPPPHPAPTPPQS
jgi:hypothetical protein